MSALPPYPPEDGPSAPSTPPAEPSSPPGRPAWRTWVIAAGLSALVAGGIGFAVSRSSGSSASATNAGASASGSTSSNAAPAGARNGARGTVTKIDGSDITIDETGRNNTKSSVVVRSSANTTFTKSADGTVSDVKTGDSVVVMGTDSSGTIAATSIRDTGDTALAGRGAGGNFTPPSGGAVAPPQSGGNGRQRGFGGGGFQAGKVTAVDGSTITISSINGSAVTVTTDSSTTVTVTQSASLADVKVGDTIMATGTNDNGVVTATSVRIGDAGFGGGPGGPGGGFPGGAPPAGAAPGDANASSS